LKLLIACGGTSGHINPAIAVANEFKKNIPETEILFVGTKEKLEADLVPRAGYDMKYIEVTGLKRSKSFSSLIYNGKALLKFLNAESKVKNIIKEFKPDIVLGTGGYVSAPVMSAAVKMHIKTIIHEQNAFAGVTTQMLAPKVDRILLSFPLSNPLKCDKSKCIIVGNPAKQEFYSIKKDEARMKLGIDLNEPLILSYGGSLGAKKVNEAFCEMAKISASENFITHFHGAARDFNYVRETLGDVFNHPRIKVFEYIYNMSEVMAAADLVISRSGAMTLTELAALGKASILIPSPNVTENHQYYNAKAYEDAGAAILIPEDTLNGASLYSLIRELIWDKHRLNSMGNAARSLSHKNAAFNIYEEILKLKI
jgi:UDP-N-acetylglucosamine--N-acetylmuramyl-(pentapeptide) pyrophosphoryl-undecaprenol N-acetylglucosamine transferase